jgi:hypothetical protein
MRRQITFPLTTIQRLAIIHKVFMCSLKRNAYNGCCMYICSASLNCLHSMNFTLEVMMESSWKWVWFLPHQSYLPDFKKFPEVKDPLWWIQYSSRTVLGRALFKNISTEESFLICFQSCVHRWQRGGDYVEKWTRICMLIFNKICFENEQWNLRHITIGERNVQEEHFTVESFECPDNTDTNTCGWYSCPISKPHTLLC